MKSPTRVLVVDDSALMRKLISQMLGRDGSIQVVGTAMDGAFALNKIPELKPQVVTLDLEMPRMDGLETLREITRRHRLPVIVVSAHSVEGASATLKALSLGAFDFVTKPKEAASAHMEEIAQELVTKVKVAASVQMRSTSELKPVMRRGVKTAIRLTTEPNRVVAIGVSTGGPNAIEYVLSQLPPDYAGSIVVVQHMPEGFTNMFARRLDEICNIQVKEAQSGDMLVAGRALVCPGNRHIRVKHMPMGNVVVLSDEERVNGHRPSVDVLFRSLAQEYGKAGIAVLMTGMGEDGAEGMGAVKHAGGLTIAQDEDSCVVFGMPRAAIERGHAIRVVPLDALANTLMTQCLAQRTGAKANVSEALAESAVKSAKA